MYIHIFGGRRNDNNNYPMLNGPLRACLPWDVQLHCYRSGFRGRRSNNNKEC